MSQSTIYTSSPSVASASFNSSQSPPWEPLNLLKLNIQTDGTFNCSGVKNGTISSCGWRLGVDTSERITDMLDDMSAMAPLSTLSMLDPLASTALCHHHKRQARAKISDWGAKIRSYAGATPLAGTPSSTFSSTPMTSVKNEGGLNGWTHINTPWPSPSPSPSGCRSPSASRIESGRSASKFSVPVTSNTRFDDGKEAAGTHSAPSISPGTALDDEMHALRLEIKRLTDRLAALETGAKSPNVKGSGSGTVVRDIKGQAGLRSQSRIFGILGKK